MAQNVRIVLTCDVDGSEEDVSTVTFGVGDDAYVLELCAADRAKFEGAVEPYIAAARRESNAGSRPRSTRASRPARAASAAAGKPSDIREWAHANRYAVSGRGRISAEVREAYEAAIA